jgi:hypothetical protein
VIVVNEPKEYVQARDLDLAAQRQNRALFARLLQAKPWWARLFSVVFMALGVILLLILRREAKPVWVLSIVAWVAAARMFVMSRRRK